MSTSCEPARTSAYSEDLRWRMVWQSERWLLMNLLGRLGDVYASLDPSQNVWQTKWWQWLRFASSTAHKTRTHTQTHTHTTVSPVVCLLWRSQIQICPDLDPVAMPDRVSGLHIEHISWLGGRRPQKTMGTVTCMEDMPRVIAPVTCPRSQACLYRSWSQDTCKIELAPLLQTRVLQRRTMIYGQKQIYGTRLTGHLQLFWVMHWWLQSTVMVQVSPAASSLFFFTKPGYNM